MGLHNFIKIYPGYKKDIYNTFINILDNITENSNRKIQESNST